MRKISYQEQVERWDVWEVSCPGPAEGNPFADHKIKGSFVRGQEKVEADGFYDGDGIYKVRFMPSYEGEYTFTITADFLEEEEKGSFVSTPAGDGNHGPVRVADTYHLDRKSTRLNSSHSGESRMPSSA